MAEEYAIKIIDVDFKIGNVSLFHQLNAQFKAGAIIGLIGPNGSGKTCFLNLLSGICQPQCGKILLFNQDLYQFPEQVKASIAFVPAQTFLYPYLTVAENLYIVAKLKQIPANQLRENIAAALDLCQMSNYTNSLFKKLSDGLKKRAMIAAALVHQPSLLILDEPCAQLDPTQRQQLWALLAKLRAPKRLILFSSHHPEEISTLCDQFINLSQNSYFSQIHIQRKTNDLNSAIGNL